MLYSDSTDFKTSNSLQNSMSLIPVYHNKDFKYRKKELLNEVLSKDEETQMKLMGNSIIRKYTNRDASPVHSSNDVSLNFSKTLSTSKLFTAAQLDSTKGILKLIQ